MRPSVDVFLTEAVKSGVTLRNLPLAAFHTALACAARSVSPERVLSEREINVILRDWLDHEGSFIRTDHVELRRLLVDFGLLRRDGFGRSYWRPEPPPEFATIFRKLESVDVRTAVAQARDDAARERTERAKRRRAAIAPRAVAHDSRRGRG